MCGSVAHQCGFVAHQCGFVAHRCGFVAHQCGFVAHQSPFDYLIQKSTSGSTLILEPAAVGKGL